MAYNLLADLVTILHFLFVLFALMGGLLVIRWRKMILMHLPSAFWAAGIEFSGWICPLTPLENWLRIRGGAAGYAGDFVGQYVLKLIYPAGLTRDIQVILGVVVIGINIVIYGYVLFMSKSKSGNQKS
jgi:hypothetical protein